MDKHVCHIPVLLLVFILLNFDTYSQAISISEFGNPPDPSSMLDIQSSDKGLLIPRISLANINITMIDGLNVSATGLLIYNTNPAVVGGSGIGFYSFNGSTWEKLVTGNTAGIIDLDFYEEGTTGPPNAIDDDMFTHGNLGVGTESPEYPLDVSSIGTRGMNTMMSGAENNDVYGDYIENNNLGDGNHYGSFNILSGSGEGFQYGTYQEITNSADGAHYGNHNVLLGTGNGSHYGSSQIVSNSGSGSHYGVSNLLSGVGNGTHFGSRNTLSGSGTGIQYGNYQHISNTGLASHYGSFNILSGSGVGAQYGSNNAITNDGDGIHIGTSNTLSGAGVSDHFGTYNNLSGLGLGDQYGSRQLITNDGAGVHYGSRNTLAGIGSGNQYGTSQTITNKGDGQHFGSYNRLEGDGKGPQYGSYQSIVNTGEGERYGSYNNLFGSSSGTKYGTYQNLSSNGSGRLYGTYNLIDGSSDVYVAGIENVINNAGDAIHFGSNNKLGGGGDGEQFGCYTTMTNTGTGNKYGTYAVISSALPGMHYGVYSWVSKAESFAGYFKGNVYIGDTDAAIGPRPKFQVTDGTDASFADGSGFLTLGEQDDLNLVIDNNEILARNNGLSSTLYVQRDGGNLLLAADEMGAVGIGVSSEINLPGGYLLAVDGNIIAEEVRVELSGDWSWPDYVFHPEYDLESLPELEKQIYKNGHLPGIPSAKVIEDLGFDLGEMQKMVVEKVEELTLYMIKANKQIHDLEYQNQKLEARINFLESN